MDQQELLRQVTDLLNKSPYPALMCMQIRQAVADGLVRADSIYPYLLAPYDELEPLDIQAYNSARMSSYERWLVLLRADPELLWYLVDKYMQQVPLQQATPGHYGEGLIYTLLPLIIRGHQSALLELGAFDTFTQDTPVHPCIASFAVPAPDRDFTPPKKSIWKRLQAPPVDPADWPGFVPEEALNTREFREVAAVLDELSEQLQAAGVTLDSLRQMGRVNKLRDLMAYCYELGRLNPYEADDE